MKTRHVVTVVACALGVAAIHHGARAQATLRTRVHASGFTAPVGFVQDPTDAAVQFVVEQAGRIRTVRNGTVLAQDFLDIRGSVLAGGERGLLGLAFPPNAGTTGRFFVNFTNTSGHTVVARFRRSANPAVGDPNTRFDLKWGPSRQGFIEQPFSNHNGGNLAFGPDGYLYIGLGDGGSGNDPGHRAQSRDTLLGKMLRIDVAVPDSHPSGYVVPGDNPFITDAGTRPEIWSFGLRNPWRYTFDAVTGALLIADVGQSSWEEINHEPANAGGRNYGWRNREGAHDHVASLPPAFLPLTDPIHEYGRSIGGSIAGGYVYRGSRLGTAYFGRYFFGDLISNRVFSIGLTLDPLTGNVEATARVDHTVELGGSAELGGVVGFGVDAEREMYIVSYGRGAILKIVGPGTPPSAPTNLRIIR